ncbi:alginate O-acetyltransferase [Pseudomonas sp. LRF_L74]|uniref:alginate O-acetyltransferase n=1 Tax=Pseudomonas sp. LRF_L74 TaxID=3369422 RepID=UPI003F61B931
MNRTANLVYSAAFGATLIGLGLWSLKGFTTFSVAEGTPVLNGKLSHAFEKHYDDEFPVKKLGTNVWAAVDYTLFGEGRPGVLIGEDGWLYSDEEFKPVVDGRQHLQDNLAIIQGVSEELAKHNVKLMLAVIPAKSRLYPEHVGENKATAMRANLYQRLHSTAGEAQILAPDLLSALKEAKQRGQVFLRTDTHWTPMGAEVVAQRLADAVRQNVQLDGDTQEFVTEAVKQEDYKGDLTTFLPLDPLFANMLPKPDQLQIRQTRAADDSEAGGDALFADTGALPVALVGTSYSANPKWNFAGALRQSLQRDLSNQAEDGHGPVLPMLKYLQSDELKNSPPQLVIWEFPERYLPMANDLSGFDPAWIAELKNSQGNENLAHVASN